MMFENVMSVGWSRTRHGGLVWLVGDGCGLTEKFKQGKDKKGQASKYF